MQIRHTFKCVRADLKFSRKRLKLTVAENWRCSTPDVWLCLIVLAFRTFREEYTIFRY